MKRRGEHGQALVMTAALMGIVLVGAIGLALDSSHLYAEIHMAQVAADAAAEAGIVSIFNGTNSGSTNPSPWATPPTACTPTDAGGSCAASFTCATTDVYAPCSYARKNGFGSTASDTVTVEFPTAAK